MWTLPLPGTSPYPSTLLMVWIPPSDQELPVRYQSAASPGSHSSSSFTQENTAKVVLTQNITPSSEPPTWADFVSLIFTTQKMKLMVISSGTTAPATPLGVQWHKCVAVCYIFDDTVPPVTPQLKVSSTTGHGHKSTVLISPPPSRYCQGSRSSHRFHGF